MKKALLILPLLCLCACTEYKALAPNHFGIKPSYEIDKTDHQDPTNKYRVETSLDWNW